MEIKPSADSSSELFYKFSEDKYQYYFNFGVVVFTGFTEEEMRYAVKTINPYQRTSLATSLRDDFQIAVEPDRDLLLISTKLMLAGWMIK